MHLRTVIGTAAALWVGAHAAQAAPAITRLTPPSNPPGLPVVARFLPGQRFDLRVEATPDAGQTITDTRFFVDDAPVPPLPGAAVGTRRAYSSGAPGVHTLTAVVTQSDGQTATRQGTFEIVPVSQTGRRARNVIFLIGDGMGVAHRTAARLMLNGVSQGKANAPLAMDTFPVTGLVITHSLNSIVTDSSPGAACYSSGNKGNNNQHGVFPDDTTPGQGEPASLLFDNPRVELIGEYLRRTQNKALGIVTTSDVFDATPAAFASHTQSRNAGTGIVDEFFDERNVSGLRVLMGGGRKWFLPRGTPGSARSNTGNGGDYVLPADLASAWGVPAGALDEERDLIGDFTSDGWAYAANKTQMDAAPANATKLLGLFALSNMNVALDKINGRRGATTVVNDYGFPDQPMLDEMTEKALQVLNRNRDGFVLMVEGASIDKQGHNMDSERWILDTIEFDRAVAVCRRFAEQNPDTLIIVTADHECAGINIIGGSRVSNAELQARAAGGGGAAALRGASAADPDRVVGTYEAAGFPRYEIAPDGYPVTTDVNNRLLIGYAGNADRYEDWLTNPLPLQDSQQPFTGVPPLSTYPAGPLVRDVAGQFLVTGQVPDAVAVHTASDVPLSAYGRGALLFTGVQDNTDVFFKAMQVLLGGAQ